uniref:Cdc42 effector-like domain-containing protein n=1 Tax=Zonotrichia albicollis TaxID=44394 RepID=A0A8D2MBT4_ZONAL
MGNYFGLQDHSAPTTLVPEVQHTLHLCPNIIDRTDSHSDLSFSDAAPYHKGAPTHKDQATDHGTSEAGLPSSTTLPELADPFLSFKVDLGLSLLEDVLSHSLPSQVPKNHLRMASRPSRAQARPVSGSVQGQAGRGLEQPGIMDGVPAHDWGLEMDGLLRSLQIQTILWFHSVRF